MAALKSQVELNSPVVENTGSPAAEFSKENLFVCFVVVLFWVFFALVFVSTAFSYLACVSWISQSARALESQQQ